MTDDITRRAAMSDLFREYDAERDGDDAETVTIYAVPVEPVETGYWCEHEGMYFTDEREHQTEGTWRKRDGGPLGHYGYECEGCKLTVKVVVVEVGDRR